MHLAISECLTEDLIEGKVGKSKSPNRMMTSTTDITDVNKHTASAFQILRCAIPVVCLNYKVRSIQSQTQL